MFELLKLFFDICLLKKGPQDIPGFDSLFRLLILVHMTISFIVLRLSIDETEAMWQIVVEVILIFVMTGALLFFTNQLSRFQQTASALLGTGAVISFFAIPAMATLVTQGTELAFFAVILLMIWHWAVTGHIFSQALEQSFSFGLGIAFIYILVSYQVIAFLFPEVIIVE
jgi:hypothetical protein